MKIKTMKIKTITLLGILLTLSIFTMASCVADTKDPAADVSAENCADTTAALNCFISKWDTTKTGTGASATNVVELPLVENGAYNFYVDWGDETDIENITAKAPHTHAYEDEGEYTIHIAGEIKGWRFFVSGDGVAGTDNDYGDAVKLLDVSQWGSLSLGNTDGRQFYGAANFNPTASDAPNLSETTSLVAAFKGALVFNGAIGNWNVSTITSMGGMFNDAVAFDQELSGWNVSAVTTMQNMFQRANNFNSPLLWADKTQYVTSMANMFQDATLFDQDISKWNVSAVVDMENMFANAAAFDQDLSKWNVSPVAVREGFDVGTPTAWTEEEKPNWDICIADTTAALNCFISKWDTTKTGTGASAANVVELPLVENGAYNFYVDWGDETGIEKITGYDDTKAPHTHAYEDEGEYTIHIAGEIKGWRFFVSEATSAGTVNDYGDAVKLLDVSQWGSLSLGNTDGRQFYGAANFNPTASDAPNLSETTSLVAAFEDATSFNGAIGNWDVSTITSMGSMFNDAKAFDQELSGWNVSAVTTMQNMFQRASNFNSPLLWADKTKNVTTMASMFVNAELFDQDLSKWNVSAVSDMAFMFGGAKAFKQDLSGWGQQTKNVTSMVSMFESATVFNGAIGNWNVSAVKNMERMFWGAVVFNQDISGWNVGAVTDMRWMFDYAAVFNQDLSKWNVCNVPAEFGDFFDAGTAATWTQKPNWGMDCPTN